MNPCVYIGYNAAGVVLYVGKSISFDARVKGHKSTAKWFSSCDHFKIIHCQTEDDALRVEGEKIEELKPRFNYSRTSRLGGRMKCHNLKRRLEMEIFRSHVQSAIIAGKWKNLPEELVGRISVMAFSGSLKPSRFRALSDWCHDYLEIPRDYAKKLRQP